MVSTLQSNAPSPHQVSTILEGIQSVRNNLATQSELLKSVLTETRLKLSSEIETYLSALRKASDNPSPVSRLPTQPDRTNHSADHTAHAGEPTGTAQRTPTHRVFLRNVERARAASEERVRQEDEVGRTCVRQQSVVWLRAGLHVDEDRYRLRTM